MFGYKGFSSKKSAGKTREETHDKQKEVLRKRNLYGSNHHRRIGDVPGGRDQRLKPESSANLFFYPVRLNPSAFRSPEPVPFRGGHRPGTLARGGLPLSYARDLRPLAAIPLDAIRRGHS